MNLGLIELSFFFGIVLAVAIWELVSVRRSLRRVDRDETKQSAFKDSA